MSEIRIADVATITTNLKNSDKVPISVGDNIAHTVTLQKIKEFCSNTITRISWNDITDKPLIPTKTSDLRNDSTYQTKSDVDTNINSRDLISQADLDTSIEKRDLLTKNEATLTYQLKENLYSRNTPIIELDLNANSVYTINANAENIEKVVIKTFPKLSEPTTIIFKNVRKPIKIEFLEEPKMLTPVPSNIETDGMFEIRYNFIKAFFVGGVK